MELVQPSGAVIHNQSWSCWMTVSVHYVRFLRVVVLIPLLIALLNLTYFLQLVARDAFFKSTVMKGVGGGGSCFWLTFMRFVWKKFRGERNITAIKCGVVQILPELLWIIQMIKKLDIGQGPSVHHDKPNHKEIKCWSVL